MADTLNNSGTVSGNSAPDDLQSQPAGTADAPVNPELLVSDPLLTDKLHPEDLDSRWNSWRCAICGYVYEGQNPLMKCPKCGNEDPDKFDDAS